MGFSDNYPHATLSADGKMIIGYSEFSDDPNRSWYLRRSWIWTEESGRQWVDQLWADEIDGIADWRSFRLADISANGRYLVGDGINPDGVDEAFLIDLGVPVPEPSTAVAACSLLGLLFCQRRREFHRK